MRGLGAALAGLGIGDGVRGGRGIFRGICWGGFGELRGIWGICSHTVDFKEEIIGNLKSDFRIKLNPVQGV